MQRGARPGDELRPIAAHSLRGSMVQADDGSDNETKGRTPPGARPIGSNGADDGDRAAQRHSAMVSASVSTYGGTLHSRSRRRRHNDREPPAEPDFRDSTAVRGKKLEPRRKKTDEVWIFIF